MLVSPEGPEPCGNESARSAKRQLLTLVQLQAIQDLLAEDLTVILIALLRLGFTRRNAKAWHQAQEGLAYIEAVATDDETAQRQLADRVTLIAKEVRQAVSDLPLEPTEVRPLVGSLIEKIGGEKLRHVWPAYQREADFQRVIDGLVILLEESVGKAADWNDALDKIRGAQRSRSDDCPQEQGSGISHDDILRPG